MLGFIKKSPEHRAALDRVREWTRARFMLPEDATIAVSEVTCALPGCPPLETVIVFWEGETRHHYKIFKPVSDVVQDDLPFAWLKDAIAVPEDFVCDCC
jgi:nitrate reductase delta subunit